MAYTACIDPLTGRTANSVSFFTCIVSENEDMLVIEAMDRDDNVTERESSGINRRMQMLYTH